MKNFLRSDDIHFATDVSALCTIHFGMEHQQLCFGSHSFRFMYVFLYHYIVL
jgi:hypothetical protein